MIEVIVSAIYDPKRNDVAKAFIEAIGQRYHASPTVHFDPLIRSCIIVKRGIPAPNQLAFESTVFSLAAQYGIDIDDVAPIEYANGEEPE